MRAVLGVSLPVLAFVAACGLAPDARADDKDPWLARDKALHFDVSAGLAAAGYGVAAGWIVDARWKALAVGGGVALVAGAAKSCRRDGPRPRGSLGGKDFAWDAIGTVAGLALAWGVDLLLGGVDAVHPALASPGQDVAPAAVRVRF